MNSDRAAGAVCLGFALALWFWLIPWQIETVDYGWLRPRSMPQILSVALGLGGIWLILRPGEETSAQTAPWLRGAGFALILIAGLWLMGRAGFLVAAPLIAAAVMGLAGERRLLWLVLGAGIMPVAIWLVVVEVLNRPLP